ncbi:MAG: methionyl-tRNA formyltransferase [Candidatus Berkiella sp.]
MRIVFAGTPDFAGAQLQALIDAKFNIVGVFTQPDKPAGRGQHLHASPVKTLALMHHISVEQPSTFKTQDAILALEKYKPDLLVVAAYGLILPKAVLAMPTFGCINVHASLLPRWRGASPIQQAILHGDKETGITLMQMDEGLDTGDILATQSYTIKPEDTATTLHDVLCHIGAQLLVEKLLAFSTEKSWPNRQPQSSIAVPATHAGKIHKDQAIINWNTQAIEIDRKIRAFNPWPVAFTNINGQPVRIFKATMVPNQQPAKPGQIIAHTPNGVVIATLSDAILLIEAQLPGKKKMLVSELLKGHHDLFKIGSVLG